METIKELLQRLISDSRGDMRQEKKSKMIATETSEHTEGKYSVLSVYSVAENIKYIQLKTTDNIYLGTV